MVYCDRVGGVSCVDCDNVSKVLQLLCCDRYCMMFFVLHNCDNVSKVLYLYVMCIATKVVYNVQ